MCGDVSWGGSSVYEIHGVPVCFKIPEGQKKENMVQVQRQFYFFHLRFYTDLIFFSGSQLINWDDNESRDVRHLFFCGIQGFNYKGVL